jgi:glycosidase
VQDEIARTIGFWLLLGLSGFRVDAVPFLLETTGQDDAGQLPDPHDYLADLRAFLGRRSGDGVLLGEVNLPYPDTMAFFGAGCDELTMCFDFIGMQRMYLSLARGNAEPLAEALRERPEPPKDAHWATFVRNHDELTPDKLTDTQRREVFEVFGPDPQMQLYGRGLRRRLPTMLGGDQDRIGMVYSLLFALPGTPVLFYGEEIGMGEDLRGHRCGGAQLRRDSHQGRAEADRAGRFLPAEGRAGRRIGTGGKGRFGDPELERYGCRWLRVERPRR